MVTIVKDKEFYEPTLNNTSSLPEVPEQELERDSKQDGCDESNPEQVEEDSQSRWEEEDG